jgi:two-component system phosphate regulon response regulator PhoB
MTRQARTILVVDDEPHVVHVLKFKLEQAGFRVVAAFNGRQAYDLALAAPPDLVITAFQMPGGSGLDLAQRLAGTETTQHVPLIMLTARGHRAPLAELARTSVRSLLAKPFSPRGVLDKVRELLPESGAASESAPRSEAPAA